jgi:D-beta-D-heptose 7-phosphate kinase/D-beta-D-heptose 1-phosphate adenosyltransferase
MKMSAPDRNRLARIAGGFGGKRVLILGDLMLDRYIWGDVSRISPEAPVPVVEVQKDSLCMGGAGNVARNILSLGGTAILAGIVGDDKEGKWIRDQIPGNTGIFADPARPTTVKTRIIARHQQVVRVDLEKKMAVTPQMEEKLLDFLGRETYDGLLISDYNKGIVNPSLTGKTLALAAEKRVPVFVDPKVEHFLLFSPITLLTPNHFEAEKIVRHECRTDDQVAAAGFEILSQIRSRYLIIKRGEHGMAVFGGGEKPVLIPTVAREVFDVTGAGDTVIAAASLALLAGARIEEAAVIANAAAGIVVGKVGTAAVTSRELLAAL